MSGFPPDPARGSIPVEVFAAPTRCPVCRATDLSTTSKQLDRTTYWRCHACGEVWNVTRRQSAIDYRFGRRG
jgi:transposase-like protein